MYSIYTCKLSVFIKLITLCVTRTQFHFSWTLINMFFYGVGAISTQCTFFLMGQCHQKCVQI